MDLDTEHKLVEQAKTDPEAFGVLFDTYYQTIVRYVIRRTGSVMIAEDLTATAFMRALIGLPKFRWQGVSIEAWLYAIASNELRMYFRKNDQLSSLDALYEQEGFEPQADYDIVQEAQDAQERIERHEAFVKAQEVLRTLPLKYQEVLILRFAEHKKISEIAQILGKREGTVKSLLSRGLTLLRKGLHLAPAQPILAKRIAYSEGQELSKPQEEYER